MIEETSIDSVEQQRATFAEIVAAAPAPVVTIALILINVAIFLAMIVAGISPISPQAAQVLKWGADYGPLTLNGQWWRLITACFLHFGVIHIAMNMYILYQSGRFTEILYGRLRYFVLYMLAGVAGNLLGLWSHPNTVAAGASGAIFGVYGGLLAFLLVQRGVVPKPAAIAIAKSAGIFLVYNLIYSLRPGTDMEAHLGGLAGGFLAGCALARPISLAGSRIYPVRTGLTCIAGLLLTIAAFLALQHRAVRPDAAMQALVITGQSVTIGNNNRVYYRGSATRAEAESLGRALADAAYFRAANGMVILTRNPQGPVLSLLTNEFNTDKPYNGQPPLQRTGKRIVPYTWDDPKYLNAVRLLAAKVAPSVGGPPLQVEVLDRQGEVEKTLSIEDRIATVGVRDIVWCHGPVTSNDVAQLAAVLKKDGIFSDTGRQVYLAKDDKSYTVSFMIPDGKAADPHVVSSFQAIRKQIAAAFAGHPLQMRLIDSSLATQKVLP